MASGQEVSIALLAEHSSFAVVSPEGSVVVGTSVVLPVVP